MKIKITLFTVLLLAVISCDITDEDGTKENSTYTYGNSIKIGTESNIGGMWSVEEFSEQNSFQLDNFLEYNNIVIRITEFGLESYPVNDAEDYSLYDYKLEIETSNDNENFNFIDGNLYCEESSCRIRSRGMGFGDLGYSIFITFQLPISTDLPVNNNELIELEEEDIISIVFTSSFTNTVISKTINITNSE